eukprot:3662036-Ditylum_brightwellii.AAC.3
MFDHGKYLAWRQVELIDVLDCTYRQSCKSHLREMVQTTNSAIPTSKKQDVKMSRWVLFSPTRTPKRHLYSTHAKTHHLALDPAIQTEQPVSKEV